MIDLSIIVCTYNRQEHLRNFLKSVVELPVEDDPSWEALVIDNNSSDSTGDIVHDFCARGAKPLRYVFEGRQGKSFALNTGIKEAGGRILVFTDDDAILPSDWIAKIREEFAADPELAGLGGRVELYNSDDSEMTSRRAKTRQILEVAQFPVANIPIIGCNMAIRRDVFDRIGGFETRLGPGAVAGVGEDLDFLYRALKAGFKIAYSPEVLVYHDHGRQTKADIERVRKSYIVGRGGFYWKHIRQGDRYIAKLAMWEIRGILRRASRAAFSGGSPRSELSVLGNLLGGAAALARARSSDDLRPLS